MDSGFNMLGKFQIVTYKKEGDWDKPEKQQSEINDQEEFDTMMRSFFKANLGVMAKPKRSEGNVDIFKHWAAGWTPENEK